MIFVRFVMSFIGILGFNFNLMKSDVQRCSLSIIIMLLYSTVCMKLKTTQPTPICWKNNIYFNSQGTIESITVRGEPLKIIGDLSNPSIEKSAIAQLWYGDEIIIKTNNIADISKGLGIIATRKCFYVSQNIITVLTSPFDWKCNEKVVSTVPFNSATENIPKGLFITIAEGIKNGAKLSMTCKSIYNPEPRKMGNLKFGIDDYHELVALNGYPLDMTGITNSWNSIRSVDLPYREGDMIEITGTNDGGSGTLRKPDQSGDLAFIAAKLTYANNKGVASSIVSNEKWTCNASSPEILNAPNHPAYSPLGDQSVKAIWDKARSERSRCFFTSPEAPQLPKPNEPVDPVAYVSPFDCNS